MITYIFAVSALGVFGMVGLKMVEVRRRKKIFISNFLASLDHSLLSKKDSLAHLIDDGYARLGVFVKQELPRHLRYFYFTTKKMVKEKYEVWMPNLHGRFHLRRNGDVSSFLRDIAKHKKENGSGRIDDEATDGEPPTTNS
jgi:hypothetical protein